MCIHACAYTHMYTQRDLACSSVDWAWACKPKGSRFKSQSGHRPGLPAWSPGGGVRERQLHIDVSLPLFLPHFPSLQKNLFFKDFIYLFLERGERRRKRGKETSMCGCLSHAPIGDLAINPGMCPDWESNQRAFGLQAHAQSTELHQLGPVSFILYVQWLLVVGALNGDWTCILGVLGRWSNQPIVLDF